MISTFQVDGLNGLDCEECSVASISSPPQVRSKIPVWPLLVAVIADVVAVVLFLPATIGTSALGYLLAPFVVTAVIGIYRYQVITASQSQNFRPGRSQKRQGQLGIALLGISFLIGLGHSWIIATEIAKGLGS